MHHYGQTYLQLHHQLWELGYSDKEIQHIQRAYKLAIQVFTGYFQANGKDFFAHLVGTASILASLNAPAHVVAAGLLHNVYGRGDFGDGQKGITLDKQNQMTRVVGHEAERVLNTFHTMWWNPNLFGSIRDQLHLYDETKRTVVLMHLADHLEHNLDFGTAYYGEGPRTWRAINADILADMAELLEKPTLAQGIRRIHHINSTYEVPSEFLQANEVTSGSYWAPKSCSKRLTVIGKEWRLHLLSTYHYLRSGLYRRASITLKAIKHRFAIT